MKEHWYDRSAVKKIPGHLQTYKCGCSYFTLYNTCCEIKLIILWPPDCAYDYVSP